MSDTGAFREIAIRQMDIRDHCLCLFVNAPADNAHLSCIAETLRAPLDLMLLMCSMERLMACLTQRHQVIGTITTCLARLDVMNIEDRIFGFAITPLADVPISCKYILAHIPEVELRPLLVPLSFYARVAYLLDIKLCDLYGGFPNRQQ